MRRKTIGNLASALAIAATSGGLAWAQASEPIRTQQPTLPPRNSLLFYGGGTRAQSMGGAFLGISDDGTAATWNPAGLTQNDRIYAVIDWGVAQQEVTNHLEASEDLSSLYDNTSSQSAAQFNFLAFNGPLTLKGQRFHLAATWNRASFVNYQSESVVTDVSTVPFPVPPGVVVEGFSTYGTSSGGPEYATLAMATQIKEEKLSIGFGLNIYTGSQDDSARSIIDAVQDPVNVSVIADSIDNQDYSGVNFNVGALFQASHFSVGLNVRTPFKLESQHDARNALSTYERTSDSVLLITTNSVLLDYRSQIGMPLQVGLGFAFRPQENLILAADYEFKGFSSTKLYSQADQFDPKSDLVESDPEFNDVHQVRLGMEFQIGVGWGVIPVRAGFRTEPLPYSHWVDVNEALGTGTQVSATKGDQVVGEVYALGTGLQWRQVRFDLGWELSTVTQYASGYFSNSFLAPQFIASRENHVQRLTLGFTGYF